jgi:hypothetical protein
VTVLAPLLPSYTGTPDSTISWPTAAEFRPARITWAVLTSRSAWAAPYTGQTQRLTHLADRLRVTLELPLCARDLAGRREAYLMAASAAGNWIRMWHMQRPAPVGTLRGAPVAAAAAAAGAREISITTTAGATMLAGDVLGTGGQLLQCAYEGATADGAGALVMPLVLPLRRAIAGGAALEWDKPAGTFQILSMDPSFDYAAPQMQMGLTVELAEVYA